MRVDVVIRSELYPQCSCMTISGTCGEVAIAWQHLISLVLDRLSRGDLARVTALLRAVDN